MKRPSILPITVFIGLLSAAFCLSGCAGGSDAPAGGDFVSSPFFLQPAPETQSSALQESLAPAPQTPVPSVPETPVPQTPNGSDAAAFVGTWVHTYEYFGNVYRTTLVIDANGTAAYYNEETELGNFTASWQLINGSLAVNRSDGVSSTLTLSGTSLIETTYENGDAYQAEYFRG